MNHIFQMAQVTSNKMVHKKRHNFLAQFSIPFHMVWSVLLRVLAQKTTFWLVEILWQPIRSFFLTVFEANTRNKTHHVKGYGKLCQKTVSFLVYHFVWGHLGVLKDVFYFYRLICLAKTGLCFHDDARNGKKVWLDLPSTFNPALMAGRWCWRVACLY